MKITSRYYVYKMENGLLLEIEDRWGGTLFSRYGYETEEEIYQRIIFLDYHREVVIIKKVEASYE